MPDKKITFLKIPRSAFERSGIKLKLETFLKERKRKRRTSKYLDDYRRAQNAKN